MLHIREDIPANLLRSDFPVIENFYIEINLYKKEWLITCTYNPYNDNILRRLGIIIRTLDIHSSEYNNIMLFGDFKTSFDEDALKNFCTSYGLTL